MNLSATRHTCLRLLRSTSSCLLLTVSVIISMLWGRSYFDTDYLVRDSSNTKMTILSFRGTIYCHLLYSSDRMHVATSYQYTKLEREPGNEASPKGILGFYWKREAWGEKLVKSELHIPLWFPVLVTGMLGLWLRNRPRIRFNLREIFFFLCIWALAMRAILNFIQSIGIVWPIHFIH